MPRWRPVHQVRRDVLRRVHGWLHPVQRDGLCPCGRVRAVQDGGCVQCVGEHIAPINGACEVEEHCIAWHEDRRKRCEPGMCLSENECLPCDENCVTCEGEADFCMSCDAAQGMFLSQNVCMNNSVLAGICSIFITGGGCASCATGYDWQERTCVSATRCVRAA